MCPELPDVGNSPTGTAATRTIPSFGLSVSLLITNSANDRFVFHIFDVVSVVSVHRRHHPLRSLFRKSLLQTFLCPC